MNYAFDGLFNKVPILTILVSGRLFMVYLRAMDHALVLCQMNDGGHEKAICYLSRKMIRIEHRYNPIEKEWLALIFVIQMVWYYLHGQSTHIILKVNCLWVLMTQLTSHISWLAKLALFLT